MATIEAGVFIFLCALGFAGILLVNRLGFFTVFSAVVFIALALMMFSGYDIVVTSEKPVLATSQAVATTTVRTTAMDVDTATASYNIMSGGNTIRAEYASNSTSVLVGKQISCIDMPLRKAGSPTGTATIGTFDNSGNVVTTFGTQNVASLTTTMTWYSYCLSGSNVYTIASGDRLGIKYTGGDASNNLVITADDTNPFDGVISYRQHYSGGWFSATGSDVTMTLYKGTNETASNVTNTYSTETETTSVIDSQQMTIGYIMSALAILSLVVFGKQVVFG